MFVKVRRTASGVFSGKYGLITLRDLFRWAERYRRSPTTTHELRDWEQQLAEDGTVCLSHFKHVFFICCYVPRFYASCWSSERKR